MKTRYDRYRLITTPLYRFDNSHVSMRMFKSFYFLIMYSRMTWRLSYWSLLSESQWVLARQGETLGPVTTLVTAPDRSSTWWSDSPPDQCQASSMSSIFCLFSISFDISYKGCVIFSCLYLSTLTENIHIVSMSWESPHETEMYQVSSHRCSSQPDEIFPSMFSSWNGFVSTTFETLRSVTL